MRPCSCFIPKDVYTKSEPSHATENIVWKVKEHVFGEGVRRKCCQGFFGRKSIPSMIRDPLAVVISRVGVKRIPIVSAWL